jgi:hypothetical protein
MFLMIPASQATFSAFLTNLAAISEALDYHTIFKESPNFFEASWNPPTSRSTQPQSNPHPAQTSHRSPSEPQQPPRLSGALDYDTDLNSPPLRGLPSSTHFALRSFEVPEVHQLSRANDYMPSSGPCKTNFAPHGPLGDPPSSWPLRATHNGPSSSALR